VWKKKWLRAILATLGAILVGAVGSGVWESKLGPVLRAIRIGILDLISLTFKNYKDHVYHRIGLANTSVVDLLTLGVLCFFIAVVGFMKTEYDLTPESSPQPSPNKRAFYFWFGYSVYFAMVLVVLLGSFTAAQMSYVESAIVHYNQALRIASPYMDMQQRLQIDADFAQVRNRQDYVTILEKLHKIAQDHGQKITKFDAW